MSPVTHLLISWSIGSLFNFSRKERIVVTLGGIAPDIDGIGLVFDLICYDPNAPLSLWSRYHHLLGHNIGFGLAVAAGAFFLAARRRLTAAAAMLTFHVHLLCDIAGARGPDGDQWPIPYLLPFSDLWQLAWNGQWALNAWQNFVITSGVICFIFWRSWKIGVSPLELFSKKADQIVVETLRLRFGNPADSGGMETGDRSDEKFKKRRQTG